jgi:hypothetical protein
MNYFNELNAVDCSGKTEKKNGLTYLSWVYAWTELKKRVPDANYTVYENREGWNYFTDGRTCWVKTGVTVNGIEHIEYLPVMDYRNASIPLDKVTSFDVNKAIQRSLTKACARHGLGLYIYAGEDLPEEDPEPKAEEKKPAKKATAKAEPKKDAYKPLSNETYWKVVQAAAAGKKTKSGKTYRDAFIEETNAPAEIIASFDADVLELQKIAKGEE